MRNAAGGNDPRCCVNSLSFRTEVCVFWDSLMLSFLLFHLSSPSSSPSQPQKVERAEEPDVFSPPTRFSHKAAWLHCKSD